MLVVCVVVRAVVFVLVGAQAFLVSDMALANVVMTTVLASASAAVVAMMMLAAVVLASAAVVAMMFGASAASMFGFQVIVNFIEIVHACGQNKFSSYTLK